MKKTLLFALLFGLSLVSCTDEHQKTVEQLEASATIENPSLSNPNPDNEIMIDKEEIGDEDIDDDRREGR